MKDAEVRAWARERGIDVPQRGAVPAALREQAEAEADAAFDGAAPTLPDDSAPPASPAPVPGGPPGEIPPDLPPARLSTRRRGGKRAPARAVTPAIRQDMRAKIAFLLMLPASAWSAHDPVCGKAMIGQVPEIADALADLAADSPELVAWLAGPGGSAMKWLKLAAAVQPVAVVVVGHHVMHSIGDGSEPLAEKYAA